MNERNCSTCGLPIDPERLEAVPFAELCVACQAGEELLAPRAESTCRLGELPDETEFADDDWP